jgi:hypothetical protein
MTIRTRAGETVNVDFAAPDASHAEAKSFTVVVPDPGPVASVEVSKGLRVIPFAKGSTRARAQGMGAPASAAPRASVTWTLEDEYIAARWNAAAEPFLAVTLVHRDGQREVLATELTGGDVRIFSGKRAPDTRVELTLGTEVSARRIVAE